MLESRTFLTGVTILAAVVQLGCHVNPSADTAEVAGARVYYTLNVNILEENSSGVSGRGVIAEPGNGRTLVSIAVSGPPGTYPAYIFRGRCGAQGTTPRYELQPVVNGTSTTELRASFDEVTRLAASIVLQRSPTDHTIVACGDAF